MKKLVSVLALILALALCGSALAATAQLGSTGLSLTIPSSMEQDTLTADDTADGLIGYWYGDDLDIAVYLESNEGYTLAEEVQYYQTSGECLEAGYISGTCAGYQTGYYTFKDSDDNGTYYGVGYIVTLGGQDLEVVFYMDSLSSQSSAESIMRTLSGSASVSSGTAAAAAQASADDDYDDASYSTAAAAASLTGTRLTFTLPAGFAVYEPDPEDTADGLTQGWYSSNLFMGVYVEDAGSYTLESLASEIAADSSYTQHGTTTLSGCGLDFVYAVESLTEDGDTYNDIYYITVLDGKTVTIVFQMESSMAQIASQVAANIMESLKLQ